MKHFVTLIEGVHFSLKIIFSIALFVIAIPIILYIYYLFGHGLLEGGMLGGDTPYHLGLMHALDRFYPSIPLWFPFAGSGSSLILGYWSFSYYLAIFASHLTNMNMEQWVRLLEFVSAPVVGIGIYIYIWVRFKNQVMALLGAIMYPLSSMAWGWISHAGFFSMQMSGMLYVPAFLFFDLFLHYEITDSKHVAKKRLFLLGFLLSMSLGILIHGSFFPNLYLGLPLYAVLRSQLNPRAREARFISLLRSIKVLFITLPLGLLAAAFILIPQQKYFALQPFTPTYGATDTPILPWKAFLGFERLDPLIGSLYTPLFMSLLVSVFAIIGTLIAIIKRKSIAALGIVAFFYVLILSSARYLAVNIKFLSIFLLPTATRASTITSIFLTILAAYGMWNVADSFGQIIRYFIGKIKNENSTWKFLRFGIGKATLVISTVILVVIFIKSFYYFRPKQTYPIWKGDWGVLESYPGYGTLKLDVPLCLVPGWENEAGDSGNCDDFMPKWKIDPAAADFWTTDFKDEFISSIDQSSMTRISVSPYLGWFTFSFTKHSTASMVSAPSGQSIVNLQWLGVHDVVMFLDGGAKITAKEVEEFAKWFGVRYVFFKPDYGVNLKDRYEEKKWPKIIDREDVVAREYVDTPGIVNLSDKQRVLVIGSNEKAAYTPVLQIAAKGVMDYDEAVLIEGTGNIDDYSQEELKKFDLLILRGYSYKRKDTAMRNLQRYVESGGSLFVDTGWQYVDRDWGKGPDGKGDFEKISLPEPFPALSTKWGAIGTTWEGALLDTQIGKDVTLEEIGLPVWGDKPWGMAVTDKSVLRSWAKPLLSVGESVVMAYGEYGRGKVVWSGMNIFSHAFDKDSQEEYRLLGNVFNYLLDDKKVEEGKVVLANWDNPDKVVFEVSELPDGDSTLYFAQTYTPFWKVYHLANGKTKRLDVYKAGPRFMAVMLDDVEVGDKIIFRFTMRNIYIYSFGITLLVYVLVILSIFDLLVFDRAIEKQFIPVTARFSKMFSKNIKHGAKGIIHEDEDDY